MTRKKHAKKHPRLRRFVWRALLWLMLLAVLAGVGAYGVKHYWLARLEFGVHYRPQSVAQLAMPPSKLSIDKHEFGIAFGSSLQYKDDAVLMRQLGDSARIGFAWARFDVAWSTVQPTAPTKYDWSAYDRIVSAARQQGLQLLPTLVNTPQWARASNCKTSDKCAPAQPKQFADFAHAAAAHFASQGVHAWEIWDEPNADAFWKPQPDAVAYASLLKAAYPAIKSADANATVVTGGLSSTASKRGHIQEVDFLNALYAVGAKGSFDAVGHHPYSVPILPSTVKPWSGWSRMNETGSKTLRGVMQTNGDGAKQIWPTEYGAATNGPGGVATQYGYLPVGHVDHVTEQWQSAMAADAVNYARKSGWMGPLFWNSYQDLSTDAHNRDNFFGLVRANGSHKPAYDIFQQMLAQ